MTKKDQEFVFRYITQIVFKKLKEHFITILILIIFDLELLSQLEVDALDFAIGVYYSQKQPDRK